MRDIVTLSFWAQVLAGGVRLGVPVGTAALGELIGERSGILNLGIEGQMALGALVGFSAASAASNAYIGLAVGLLVGAAVGALFGLVVVQLRGDQIVVGFAFALGGVGMADLLNRSLYENQAAAGVVPPQVVEIAVLSKIPLVGDVLFNQPPILVWLLPALTLGVVWTFRSTRVGLEIRACGFGPSEAVARGVPVRKLRVGCLILAGGLSGVAGAMLSVGLVGQYNEGMIAGRGFVALALVIACSWRASWLLGAAFLFGTLQAFALRLQTLSDDLPIALLLVLPFAVTLAILAARVRVGAAPTAIGQPLEEA